MKFKEYFIESIQNKDLDRVDLWDLIDLINNNCFNGDVRYEIGIDYICFEENGATVGEMLYKDSKGSIPLDELEPFKEAIENNRFSLNSTLLVYSYSDYIYTVEDLEHFYEQLVDVIDSYEDELEIDENNEDLVKLDVYKKYERYLEQQKENGNVI